MPEGIGPGCRPVGSIVRGEQLDGLAALLAGDGWHALVRDCGEEILDLAMVVVPCMMSMDATRAASSRCQAGRRSQWRDNVKKFGPRSSQLLSRAVKC
jgi:hypothetical protein